jgi:RHS repeat-associated protein
MTVVFSARHVGAQTLAGVEQGIKPYGSYEGGNFDSVSMVNGSLTLNIPLVSYSQRGGKLQMAFRLVYNNPWLQPFATNCNPYTKFCKTTGYNLAYIVNAGSCGYGNVSGRTCGTAMGVGGDFNLVLDAVLVPGGGNLVQYYSVTDSDNAVHVMGAVSSTQYRSADTTGYLLTAPSSSPNGTGTLWDRRGNIYLYTTWALTEIEDADGNFITANAGSNGAIASWTDTLGRPIPAPGAATATNLADCPSSATSATLWAPPGPNGQPSQYKFCWATIPIYFTPPDCTGSLGCQATSTTANVMVGLVLPNLTSWTFSYDNFGEPTTIAPPTGGGTISYTWGYTNGTCVAPQYVDPATGYHTQLWPYRRAILSRTVNANDGNGPHQWTYSGDTGNGGQTIVTDPLGNETVDTETVFGGTCSVYETESDRDNGSTLLEKVVTTYNYNSGGNLPLVFGNVAINVVPYTVTTTDETSGRTWQVVKTYDSGVPLIGGGTNLVLGDLLSEGYRDWGIGSPGPLLKTTSTNYLALSNSTYLANNLLDIPSSQQTLDGGGVQRAYTTYGYDEYALNPSGITTQHNSVAPDQSYRGNQTSVHRWLNGSTTATTNCNTSVSNGYLVSYAVYNDTGTVDHSVDSCGSSASDTNHKTSYAYSGTYVGAYPTTVTNPLGQSTTNAYDFNTGLLTSTTDPNQQTTSFGYDNMWRITSASYPDGGSATITRQETTPPFSATLTKALNSSQSYVETNIFDGLGRVAHHEITSDPQGTIYADTTYDPLGRTNTVSNPYRSTSDSTYGLTTYAYDPLSRTTSVTKPDNSLVKTAYCGPTTLVTDEAGHWRRSTSDALGRLIEVDEPNSPTATVNSNGCPGTGEPIWVTTYAYDALDDLTSVVQGGSRNRSFAFDSLKHLTSSTNPETGYPGPGAITYGYDADGNVITKKDARSITTTYSYDVGNRATGVTYSNGDPSVAYSYDQATCIGQSPCYNIGRRTTMTDAGGTEILSYDKMGREWGEQRTTNSVARTTTYTYDLAGDPTTLTYPSARMITYTYDSAERPSDAQDLANSINYATGSCANGAPSPSPSTGACYAPQGAVAQLQNGTNLLSTYIYNDRLQPCWMYATTGAALATNTACTATDPGPGNVLDLKYGFNLGSADNGNVIGIANDRDSTRSQSFTYDQVNRILSGQTSTTSGSNCWGEAYSYDQWANLQSVAYVSGYTSCTQEGTWSLTATADNQLPSSAATYDASGNVLNDNFNIYQWNAESEIKNAAGVNYTYDGDGDRLEKSSGKIYWYGAGTEILDESDLSGNFTNEYVFFGGKRIAMRNVSTGTIYYYADDMLGSSRTMVQAGQTSVCYDADFYPFGGERDVTASCAQNYKFEGKERDSETQNDDFGARYYSWRVGRWLSADWSAVPAPVPYANLTNPQTLDLYAMVSDNPETFADLDGHDPKPPKQTSVQQDTSCLVGISQGPCPSSSQQQQNQGRITLPDYSASGLSAQLALSHPDWANAAGTVLNVGAQIGLAALTDGGSEIPEALADLAKAGEVADEVAGPAEQELGTIFRSGGSSPSDLTPRAGETSLSFRDSLSDPIDSKANPVFKKSEYIAVDSRKLPVGSVVRDNIPPGHVSVRATIQDLKGAIILKGKLPQ